MGEPNRVALTKLFLLPPGASDDEIVAAIRKNARRFCQLGRKFVLRPNISLNECLETIHQRRKEELKLSMKLYEQALAIREKEKRLGCDAYFSNSSWMLTKLRRT